MGNGVFPTELFNKTAKKIREQGHEYGTVTGRPRRVGWIDLFNIKYGIIINGIDKVIITLLDALHGINPIKMCTKYELDGTILESWPIQHEIIERCKPIYRSFDGWKKKTREEWSDIAKRGYNALPENMKVYIQAIKEELNSQIFALSVGADRNDTIILDKNVFSS